MANEPSRWKAASASSFALAAPTSAAVTPSFFSFSISSKMVFSTT
jgi:hypothetical protein